jgi:excisionase family DNA binding protein
MTAAEPDHDGDSGPLPDSLLLTVPEAARVLTIGRSTLYALIAEREIETIHIGRSCRVPAEAVRDFVERRRDRHTESIA